MIRTVFLAMLALVALASTAEARQRHRTIVAHERCNIDWPCEGVVSSPRGERIVKAMGGFGSAQKIYIPKPVANVDWRAGIRHKPAKAHKRHRVETVSYGAPTPSLGYTVRHAVSQVIGGRPAGCPHAFCGCGASLQVFGRIVPSLNLAANWLRFPRTVPAPGMVAARRGHVFVLREHLGGNVWLAHDSNSGGHLTRLHPRSIAGYSIVNPHGGSA